MTTMSPRRLQIIFVAPALVLAAVAAASLRFHISVSWMTGDPLAGAHVHPLRGCVSNLGILLWCAAASICAFSAVTLRRVGTLERRRFFYYSSLLCGYLALDDLYQIHEYLVPQYLGISERVVYAILGAAVGAYLITFRDAIRRTNFPLLLLAVGFLGASAGVDALFELPLHRAFGHWEYFLEDGAKFLGIWLWFTYCADASLEALDAALASAPSSSEAALAGPCGGYTISWTASLQLFRITPASWRTAFTRAASPRRSPTAPPAT